MSGQTRETDDASACGSRQTSSEEEAKKPIRPSTIALALVIAAFGIWYVDYAAKRDTRFLIPAFEDLQVVEVLIKEPYYARGNSRYGGRSRSYWNFAFKDGSTLAADCDAARGDVSCLRQGPHFFTDEELIGRKARLWLYHHREPSSGETLPRPTIYQAQVGGTTIRSYHDTVAMIEYKKTPENRTWAIAFQSFVLSALFLIVCALRPDLRRQIKAFLKG